MVSQPEKQVYVARTVHFYDKGASLLVSYLESGDVLVDVPQILIVASDAFSDFVIR